MRAPGECWAGATCEAHACQLIYLPPAIQNNPVLASQHAARLEGIAQAVVEGSVAAVRDLMTEYGPLVAFNAGRMALQVQGCADGVVAIHLPLSPAQADAVVLLLE